MLIFEKGKEGRGLSLLPECDVEVIVRCICRSFPKLRLADITQSLRRNAMESMTAFIRWVPVR